MSNGMLNLEDPQPGFYPGVPFSDYVKVKAMNCHTLMWGKLSAKHMKAALDGKIVTEDSPALLFGRALHHRLLEPDVYKFKYVVAEQCAAILSSGKNKGKRCGNAGTRLIEKSWFCGQHGSGEEEYAFDNREVLSKEDAAAIELAAEAVRGHGAEKLRRFKGDFEITLVADLHGVRCKCRIDKFIHNPCTVVDAKKVAAPKRPNDRGGAADWFIGQIGSLGYGMQAAFYSDIVQVLTGNLPAWFWLIIEDGPPFCPAVYKASDRLIQCGRTEYMAHLMRYRECAEKNVWPGYTAGAEVIDGPGWWERLYGGLQ